MLETLSYREILRISSWRFTLYKNVPTIYAYLKEFKILESKAFMLFYMYDHYNFIIPCWWHISLMNRKDNQISKSLKQAHIERGCFFSLEYKDTITKNLWLKFCAPIKRLWISRPYLKCSFQVQKGTLAYCDFYWTKWSLSWESHGYISLQNNPDYQA